MEGNSQERIATEGIFPKFLRFQEFEFRAELNLQFFFCGKRASAEMRIIELFLVGYSFFYSQLDLAVFGLTPFSLAPFGSTL